MAREQQQVLIPTTGHSLPKPGRPQFVSVIIPIRNGAGTLEMQLRALQAQTYAGPWEVIAVDNASTDRTVDEIAKFLELMPNLRLVSANEYRGRSYACNVGARAARGDVLLFCDSDDVLGEGWLAAFAEALAEHDFVAGAIEVEHLNQRAPRRPHPNPGSDNLALGFLPYAIGANMGVARTAFEAVGGFDEACDQGQDIDLSWRLQLAGYRLVDAPQAVIHYRYPQTRKALFHRMVRYAMAHVWLFRRHKANGMPRSSAQLVLARYRRILRGLPHMLQHDWQWRDRWLLDVAVAWGHLVGSLKYRRLYL